MSLPRYAEYRECGVQWLGSIPANWKPTPLKYLADFVNGYVFKPGTWSESGTPIIRIENLNGSNNFNFYDGELDERNHVAKGDLLFGWSGNRGTSFGPVIWKRAGHYFLNQHIFKIAGTRCDVGWLYWCLKAVTTHVEDQATGIIGMVHVTKGDLGAIKVPVPSAEEQTAIATFLDRETGKIDALIAEQEKLLTLLAEKRQATISHAVTRGLNPNAPMKDSGVPWLGEVPAHWIVSKCGQYLSILSGFAFPSSRFSQDESDVKLLRGVNVGVSALRWEDVVYWRREIGDRLDAYELRTGDLVIGMDRPLIADGMRVARVKEGDLPCLLLQRVASIKAGPLLSTGFLMYLLASEMFVAHFAPEVSGVSVPHISPDQIASFVIPLPPIEEQASILFFLDAEVVKLEVLEAQTARAVVLLKERRSALIAAAVTGKIDVRGIA